MSYGEHLLIAWNTFDKENKAQRTSFVVGNGLGKIVSEVETLDEFSFYPTQSMRITSEDKYIVWVSTGDG